MRLLPIMRIALALACAVAITSCEENGTTAPPLTGPLPIGTGFWYMNTADDSTLSTTIATRVVGVAQERTQLDSSFINIGADGTYEQRFWLQIFVTGVLDRRETVIDYGTWALSGDSYLFTSSVRERDFLVAPTINGRLQTLEPMVSFVDPPETAGDYRRTRP